MMDINKFCKHKFKNPDSFYRPGYFWMWNGRMSEEILSAQLYEMNSMGSKNVLPIPLPKNFRPLIMPTEMEPEYLSKEYFNIYKKMVYEAKRLGMYVWLYDEGGWPSGSCCGGVVARRPELGSQQLIQRKTSILNGERITIPSDCLAAFLYRCNKLYQRVSPGDTIDITEDHSVIEIYCVDKASYEDGKASRYEPPYPDLLNTESTLEFIRQTHEEYKKNLGDYFGNTIQIVFTDEPRVSNPPWTDDLVNDFYRAKGYDIIEKLPYLFSGECDGDTVRVDFFDWWSAHFAKNYFETVRNWCHENSLLLAGHLAGDDETMGQAKAGYGHILRILREFDIPGIDTIWGQILPGQRKTLKVPTGNSIWKAEVSANNNFPKYASSVSHQEGKRHAISESFCVYGMGLTPAQMKWITDFQYVRGINLLIIGTWQLSTKGHFMAGERPIFSTGNPLWKYMDVFHEYVARLSYIMSLGKPEVKAAVYFPVRDIWAGGTQAIEKAESNDAFIQALLERQCDFDYIDDDILERESTKPINDILRTGYMEYHTVFVTENRYMHAGAARKLSEFMKTGGRVVFIGSADQSEIPESSPAIKISELNDYITPVACVVPDNKHIRICKRSLENGNIYFITNECVDAVECKILFDEELPAIRLDIVNGRCYKLMNALYAEGQCEIPVRLEFAGSLVILFSDHEAYAETEDPAPENALLTLDSGWRCKKIKSYEIGDSNYTQKEYLGNTLIPIQLGDWRDAFGENFSGDVEYLLEFSCGKDVIKNARFVDLGDVKYACAAYLNGIDLGKRTWSPFQYDIKDILSEGANELKIHVTNTMANQYVLTNVFKQWDDNVLGPYHKIALEMEKKSLESGLFGPVRIK